MFSASEGTPPSFQYYDAEKHGGDPKGTVVVNSGAMLMSAASLAIQKQYRTAGAKSARKTKRVEPNMWFRPTARARICHAEYHAGHGRRACHTDKRLPRRMPCLPHWIQRLSRGT